MSSFLPEEDEHLTDGWEPDLDVADSLVRQTVFVHASWATTSAATSGRPWVDNDDWAGAHRVDRGAMGNWVIVKRPLDLDGYARVLGEVAELIPPGSPYLLVTAWPSPDLRPLGMALVGHPPLMLRPATDLPAPPTQCELRWATTVADLVDAERVLVDGYPMPELQPFVAGSVYPPAFLEPRNRVVVAYDGDVPVATATAHSAYGVTLVEGVAVMPSARGKGAGAAVTAAATTPFPGQPAVLLASDDGQPVYARLGYLRIERWTAWLRP